MYFGMCRQEFDSISHEEQLEEIERERNLIKKLKGEQEEQNEKEKA